MGGIKPASVLPPYTHVHPIKIHSNFFLDGLGLHRLHRTTILQDTKYLSSLSQVSMGNEINRRFAKAITVDEYPPGYGKLAAFEECDPSFLICRKFGWLHIRVLLHLQDEVQELGEELESLDKMGTLFRRLFETAKPPGRLREAQRFAKRSPYRDRCKIGRIWWDMHSTILNVY